MKKRIVTDNPEELVNLGDLFIEGYPVVDEDGVVLGLKMDTMRLDPFPANHMPTMVRCVSLTSAKGLKKGFIYYAEAVSNTGMVKLAKRDGLFPMAQFAKLTEIASNLHDREEPANDQ